MSTVTEPWRGLWAQALEQERVALRLLRARHYSDAVYHAALAMELVAKAIRQSGALYGDLRAAGVRYGDLERYTYGQIASGLPPQRGHDADLRKIVDAPWNKRPLVVDALAQLDTLKQRMGVSDLSQATRYPDQWGGTPPFRAFKRGDAEAAVAAMSTLLEDGHAHFDKPCE
jgi:HEPN domain-containing protein